VLKMSVALLWQHQPCGLSIDFTQVYDIPDALDPESLANIAVFLNGKCQHWPRVHDTNHHYRSSHHRGASRSDQQELHELCRICLRG
jgi:hypothetical protein